MIAVPNRGFPCVNQESKLARSGLAGLFAGVEILSDKNPDSYRRVLTERQIEPSEFVMVGNSLRSDVAPVVEIGGRAVHIPYEVTWHHEEVAEDLLPATGWHRLTSIAELALLLEEMNQG